jgi:hypothetical protein
VKVQLYSFSYCPIDQNATAGGTVNLDISQSRLKQSIIPSHPLSPIFPMAFGKKEIIEDL